MIKININHLDVETYHKLYTSVGWTAPAKEQIELALKNSLFTVSVEKDGEIVGMGRLIGDGALSFVVKDIAVFPTYQRQGIGRAIVESMLTHIKRQVPKDQYTCVELFSGFDKEPFYEKFGFDKKPDGFVGYGMMKLEAGEK